VDPADPFVVVDAEFAGSEFLDARDLVQVRYEMVRQEGDSVSSAASAFGFSRPSWYAAAALDEGGLPGLLPSRPGPRRAHKLTDEVVAFMEDSLEADPSLRVADLADRVDETFGVRVHRRSIERALARGGGPKVAEQPVSPPPADGEDLAGRYEAVRTVALAEGAGRAGLGAGLLVAQGMTAWMRELAGLHAPAAAPGRSAGRRSAGRGGRGAGGHGVGLRPMRPVMGEDRTGKVTAGHRAGASTQGRAGFQRLVGRRGHGQGWPGDRPGGVTPGPEQRRLAAAPGDLRADRDAHPGRGRAV